MVPASRTMSSAVVSSLLLVLVLVVSVARAEGRLEFLAERLKFPPAMGQADDFRVRTSAALALGAINDDGAVAPLCSGLADPSEVVRQAVAVALKRLGRPAELECLRRRVGVEPNASVKAEIQRTIDAIDASSGSGGGSSGGGGAPQTVANAKYYVALSSVTNGTSRSTGEIERVVREAITSKLAQLGEYQLAPSGETPVAAKAAIVKRKLKGYYLGIGVEKFDYSDGNLRVRVRIAVFSYPGRDLRGEVPAGATLPGARPGDRGAEDQLLTVVAGQAADLFAQNFK
jgi:hypothetical protein